MSRRSLLATGGIGTALALAGCLSDETDTDADPGDGESTEAAQTEAETDDEDDEDDEGEEYEEGEEETDEPDVEHALPFEDDFSTLELLHSESSEEGLGLDTENVDQFARLADADEPVDGSRVNRTTEDEEHIVYKFDDVIGGFRVETHYHPDQDGRVSVAVSETGAVWTNVIPKKDLYSEAHNDEDAPGHWWKNYEYVSEATGDDARYIRLTLSGDVDWSPQIGWVTVWGTDGSDVETDTPEGEGEEEGESEDEISFEDDLSSMDALHTSSDTDLLGFDTTNTIQFARPEDAAEPTDPSRLNRQTDDDVHAVYRISQDITGVRVEGHTSPDHPGDISISVSSNGADWTDVDVEKDVYSEAHDDEDEPGVWWENAEYTAENLDDGVRYIRITLSGDVDWTPQIGHVEIW
ncbi:hypothetical protein [Natronoglomus mannanivorans]|uniref:Uncharacterized protein n=1 Tax=Natronoglomus mannanivorans TaxID=2979990 RepID=A0AAP2Z2J5_9EURY|nr:hypothetical protein [Halobacteria archaeon AArc-xg1-1]